MDKYDSLAVTNLTAKMEELRSRFALGDILLALVVTSWGQRRITNRIDGLPHRLRRDIGLDWPD
jgi:hypothetical protein